MLRPTRSNRRHPEQHRPRESDHRKHPAHAERPPDHLGQILHLPQASYTVQAGDTLYSIARTHGTIPDALASANHLTSSTVQVGQVLRFPSSASPASSPIPTPATRA